jgi:hypothetical protein
MIYVWTEYGHLNGYQQQADGTFTYPPITSSNAPAPDGMPGGMLSISANGTMPGTGIVWATHPFSGDANQAVVSGVLQAYDATNLSEPIWDSHMDFARDDLGKFAKFAPPTIANGKVYVATFSKQLVVYGHGDFSAPCRNGVQDAGETGIDCGGSCGVCPAQVFACATGQSTMDVGQSFTCDLGAKHNINAIGISVGCGDGETGMFTVQYDGGAPVPLNGLVACNSSFAITGQSAQMLTLKMTSGGGADNHISFSGWTVSY